MTFGLPNPVRPLVLLAAALLGGCGGGGNAPPAAVNLNFSGMEETPVDGALQGSDPEAQAITYRVVKPPAHGSLTVDAASGHFSYLANVDYFGADSFTYAVYDGTNYSVPASVTLSIANVNDAPVLGAIPDLQNSAETHDLVYSLPASDVDGDPLTISVTSDNPTVATVTSSDADRSISLSPGSIGDAQIHVIVSDGQLTTERTFRFSVGDVTKSRAIATDASAGDAITLVNTSSSTVSLTLTHNNFPMFQSDAEVIAYVRAMSPQYPNEPFEQKLWRFVRDNTYHSAPLGNDLWLYDTWVTLNSLGWGLCDDDAVVYARLGLAAGYDVRIWQLEGHVVPEIKIGDRWEMWDPDLAVYYFDRQSQVTGAEALMTDTTLITSPVDPIFADSSSDFVYSSSVAFIYGTTGDNKIANPTVLVPRVSQTHVLELPAGARFTYPGRWTAEVVGVNGTVPYPIPYYLQGMLTTPPGWTGSLAMPWMVWDIRGTGRVAIAGVEYEIGSQELSTQLHRLSAQIPSVEILAADSELQFVLFVNAMRYQLQTLNSVSLRGKDVWAVAIGTENLAVGDRPDPDGPVIYRTPTSIF